MTPVQFHFVLPTGEPMANASLEVQLSRSSYNGHTTGITLPRPITVQTDADGYAVLTLWPSPTLYFLQVQDPASDAGIFYKFLVPEVPEGTTVRLQDCVVDGVMSGAAYDDAALLAINDAKVNARASELAAAASAAQAAQNATGIGDAVEVALAARDTAVASAQTASDSAATALAVQLNIDAVTEAMSHVLESQAAAAASATDAAASKSEAGISEANALASKNAASGSATAASTSADTATQKAAAAAQSASDADGSKVAAAGSATASAQSASAAAQSAAAAATSASRAITSQDVVAALGYTPYSNQNPDHFLSQITAAIVKSALGFTPYDASNPANYITAGASITGNAATATKLQTPRAINGVSFDGSAPITVADATKLPLAGGTIAQDGRITFAPNSTWSSQLVLGGNGVTGIARSATVASVVTSNGNLHLDAGTGMWTYINNYAGIGTHFCDGNGNIVASVDVQGNFSAAAVGGQRIYTGYDAGVAGSVSCNNWFRTAGNTGLYFSDLSCGLRAAQGEYGTVGTYNARTSAGVWQGYSINGGVVFMHDGNTTGNWGIYNDYSNTWLLIADMGGNATFTGNVTAYSDRRIKRDIEPVRDALAKLLKLCGVTFERIDTGERGIGLIAQDVQEQFPEAVRESSRDAEGKDSVLTVAYGNLVGPIVEALREIDVRLSTLEAK